MYTIINNFIHTTTARTLGLLVVLVVAWGAGAMLAHPQSVHAINFGTWATSSAANNDDTWESVAYGNGLFVAVGGTIDRVMTSTNGNTWTTHSAAEDDDFWKGVTYGNGRFVAVGNFGDDRVMYSDNGTSWTTVSAAGNDEDWYDVAYGNGVFVAVSGGGTDRVMYSTDGTSWATTSAVGNDDQWFSITYGNGRFVAVGSAEFGRDPVMYSDDGITWTRASFYDTVTTWQGVTYGNGRFVAVREGGLPVAVSEDGTSWAPVSAAGDNDSWQDITFGNGLFVAVGSSTPGIRDGAMYSVDGYTWTVASSAGSANMWSAVTYGNNTFVAVANFEGNELVMVATSSPWSLSQTGFQFRDDDGTEIAATDLGGQNSNLTWNYNDNLRLRTQISSRLATTTAPYYLQYRKTSDSFWNTVGVDGNYPYIVATSSEITTGNATSHSITIPTCAPGNLLLVLFSHDGAATSNTTSSGWKKLGEASNGIIVSSAVYWKFSDGSNTLSVSTVASEESSHIVYCIANAGVPTGESFNSSNANSNPPLHTTDAVRNYLWIATRSGDSTVVATAAPSGYSGLLTQAANTTGGASTNAAHLYERASTTDPGAFTSATEQWVSWTIAIPPKQTPTTGNVSLAAGASATSSVNDTSYGSIAWSNPGNATTSNESRATLVVSSTTASNYLAVTGYGFSIPAHATIKGIRASIEKSQVTATGDVEDNSVRLLKAGVVTGNNEAQGGLAWTATDRVRTYGSAAELWGTTWTPAEINASNFGIAIAVQGSIAGANSTARIDHVIIDVYYTVTDPITLASSTFIASSGASTTAQLLIPGALTATDFSEGRIADDTNPTPSLTINEAGYTELEWNIVATGTATTGEAYQFRTSLGLDGALSSYTGSPLLTIGSYSAPSTTALSGNLYNAYGTTTSPGAGVPIVLARAENGNPVLYSTTTSAGGAYTLSVATSTNTTLNWSVMSAGENDDYWYGITYGNGRFVVVGDSVSDDIAMYSSDGITWTTVSAAGNDDSWNSVVYSNGLFVAVGSGPDDAMYSYDGITWATSSAAGNNDWWNEVTYGNGRFVAVGQSGDRVMYSTDGITWATSSAAGNNDSWGSVTYSNGRFVAVGSSGDRVMYSQDGITWATSSAAGNDDGWQAITYGNGRFVAVGRSGTDRVMYSTDGITWATSSAAGNDDGWRDVKYNSGFFVAVGDSGTDRVMYSTDGITWATSSAAGNDDQWYAVTYGNGSFIITGDGPSNERVLLSSSLLGFDTAYTLYSKSTTTPATTFLMGASGASALSGVNLYGDTVLAYNATTSATSSVTRLDDLGFYDSSDDSSVLYTSAPGATTTILVDLVTATGTTRAPSTLELRGDWQQLGTFDSNSGTVILAGTSTYNLSDAEYFGSLSIIEFDTTITDIAFNASGTKLYIVGQNSDDLDEFNLDSPYDISTAEYVDSLDVGSTYDVGSGVPGFAISSDGTKLYALSPTSDVVREASLSIPWDVSTAVLVDTLSIGAREGDAQGLAFNDDGTKLYIVGFAGDEVDEWALSTPWDVSTGIYTDSLSIAAYQTVPYALAFNNDGTKLYVTGGSGRIDEWALSTAWDVSTGVHTNARSVTELDTFLSGITFGDDDSRMFLAGETSDAVHELGMVSRHSGTFIEQSVLSDVVVATGTAQYMNTAYATTSNLVIGSGATFFAPSTTLEVTENYINDGTFKAQHNRVILSGIGTTSGVMSDSSAFYDLHVSGDYVSLGSTTVQGNYMVTGTYERGTTTLYIDNSFKNAVAYTRPAALSVSAQEATPQGFAFNNDGTKLYVVGDTGDAVDEWALSIPWDVSTGVYTDSLNIAAQEANSEGIAFNASGTKLYTIGDTSGLSAVDEWALSTPWDVSTGVYTDSILVHTGGFPSYGFAFKSDGTKMYVANYLGVINEFALSVPWDASTAVYTDALNLETSFAFFDPQGITFTNDGTRVYVTHSGSSVFEWILRVPWDVSTGRLSDVVTFPNAGMTDVEFNASNTKMYVLGANNDIIAGYDYVDETVLSGNLTATSALGNLHVAGSFPVTFTDPASTTNFTMNATSTVLAPTTTLSISGDFSNTGTFIPRAATTILTGTGETISGALTSWGSTTGPDFGRTEITGSYTVVGNATTSALTINSGASLTGPSNGSLVITHDFTNNGTYTNNGATTTLGGNLRSGATGTNALGNTFINARSQGTGWEAIATSSAAGNNDSWQAITFGNGRFVAVGAAGAANDERVITSVDGLRWVSIASSSAAGHNDTWMGVSFGNGRFVAVADCDLGGDCVMHSANGLTWATTSVAGNNDDWRSVTFGNGRFVAVGVTGDKVMYSASGTSWATASAAGDDDRWNSVAYGDKKFVAVGCGGQAACGLAGDRVMYSYDGITWATTSAAGDDDSWQSVTYGNGRFVAVGDSGDRVMYSYDGITWATTSAAGDDDSWQSVTYGNGRFVAVGQSGDRVMYSYDGITWATTSAAGDNDSLNEVIYGNDRFVAVGEVDDRIITSVGTSIFNQNASTSNLTIAASSTLNASGTTVSLTGNYTNNGTLTASSSTFVFNGTSAQVATGTMSSSSKFFNLRLENTSRNGTTSRSVTFGAPLTASGTMTMIASTSAGFLANATTTLQNVSWQGNATSPVWLRSTATGTQWFLNIPGSQLNVEYVNVRDSNATGTVGGVTAATSTNSGNNINWFFEEFYVPTITITEHSDDQVPSTLTFQNKDDAAVFGFSLVSLTETASVTALVIDVSNAQGLETTNLTDWRLYKDHDADGTLSAGDEQVGGAGAFVLNGALGSTTFNTSFVASGTKDYIITLDTNAIVRGDKLTMTLASSSISAVTLPGLAPITFAGSVTSNKQQRSRGGADGSFSTEGAPGNGIVGGGDTDAGEELGGLPNFNPPSSNGTPHNEWTNGSNGYTSDGSYASETTVTERQSYGTFGFNIPSGNTITGIEVKLEASASSNAGTIEVALSWDGGTSITTPLSTATLTTTDTIYTLGGSSNLWGRAWTAPEFQNGNFAIRLIGQPSGGNTVQVDAIQVRVYHATTGGGSGGGSGEI